MKKTLANQQAFFFASWGKQNNVSMYGRDSSLIPDGVFSTTVLASTQAAQCGLCNT